MLFDELKIEQMNALKEHNAAKRAVLENVTGKAMLVKIQKREKHEELNDTDVLLVINKVIKELDEEIEAYTQAGRSEKVAELKAQKEIISVYLPKQLSDDEIKSEIEKLEDKTIPSIMKHFKVNFAGKCDMKKVSEIAKLFQ